MPRITKKYSTANRGPRAACLWLQNEANVRAEKEWVNTQELCNPQNSFPKMEPNAGASRRD
jgi:hypothetical protein